MAKKPPIRVALDLETTGLYAEQDAILEIAAIKFQGEQIIDTFESFVAPERAMPFRVQRLTGITPELLVGAPQFETIARPLQNFLGNFPIVGHSIPFDVGFLRRRGLARTNPLIDTFELATVLLPSLSSYNLGQVAETLGVHVPEDRHRAMVDTVLAMRVFLALHKRLQSVDITLLKDLANLDAPHSWPLLHFFRQELRERQEQDGVYGSLARGSLGDQFAAQLGMNPRVLSFSIAEQPQMAFADAVVASTPLMEKMQQMQECIEVIPEQDRQGEQQTISEPHSYQMARSAIYDALEQRHPLLLEVMVGGSDYAPALLPALEWLLLEQSQGRSRRLVIACATQQHVNRLMETVLPRLQAMLKSAFPVAYLAEQGGYLCTHRWFGAALRRTSGELTAEQARGLAKLALWAQQTQTGERRELTLLLQEAMAWERICSGVERIPSADERAGTAYERCTYRRKGYCFVSRAEERVNKAQIVVTTHAGLFDDLSSSHSLLTAIPRRLILDADLLEDETARWNSGELECVRLFRLLDTVGTELADGRYQGLLALAAPSLRERGPGGLSTTPTIAKTDVDARLLNWFQVLRQARVAVESLFAAFERLLEEFSQQNASNKGRGRGGSHSARVGERVDQPLRLSGQIRTLSAWADTEQAWQLTAQRLQAVIDLAHEAERIILAMQRGRSRLDSGSSEESSVASELAAVAQQLQEQQQLGQRALSLLDADTVYWLRLPPQMPSMMQHAGQPRTIERASEEASTRPPESKPVLYAQLIQTASQLKRFLLDGTSCAIFAGTALSVDASFSFCRTRLGLEHEACPALSVVTEHHEQTLLYIPNDVPEPNTPQYQRHLDEALVHLATALDGQVVALFTSHAALRSSYATIKPILEARGILVLGQGMDGSPRQLWQIFQSQTRVVVLGAGSFWDGLDEIVQTPSCLFITRLPMPVLNDPPLAARAEQYTDQLRQFTVPVAALRMRRSLNKLLWSDTRRNAVVLFDRRVLSKDYGQVIMHSLPRCSQRQAAMSHMPETILDWLTDTGAWE